MQAELGKKQCKDVSKRLYQNEQRERQLLVVSQSHSCLLTIRNNQSDLIFANAKYLGTFQPNHVWR